MFLDFFDLRFFFREPTCPGLFFKYLGAFEQDEIVKKDNLKEFFETFKKQKNADVSMETISKSNHLFEGKLEPLMGTLNKYIQKNKS